MVSNGYNGTDPNAAVFNFLLANIWQKALATAPLVWPTSLSFAYQIGNLDSVAPVPVTINASGNWTAYTTTGWLSVTPSGVGPGTATVSVYPGVSPGTYTGAI
jgi:hypothetical protein